VLVRLREEHHRSVTDRLESGNTRDTESLPAKSRAGEDSTVEVAIQTCCGSLLALEASAATIDAVPGLPSETRDRIHKAKELLTASVEDLFGLSAAPADSAIVLGFVSRQRPVGPQA
jgi:hypothetical protein